MEMEVAWKPVLLAVIGVIAIVTSGLTSNAESKGVVAHSAKVEVIDCNSHDPLSPCSGLRLGYPSGDLYVLEDAF
ncbi:MAG TPA: hypothetical protein VGN55_14145 [Xanthobacteraceae bacterium]